ncbi:MAG: recombinase zinc beta ribbon domain-containing protein [Acidaminococcaceae bacterium]|nr:recombinase zinc beta ribbon domain-containing protein [Acidaminococcaceae bacterium]
MQQGYAPAAKFCDQIIMIHLLYDQQKYMYDNKTHSVENRIVSISQPYVRPVVRGKAKAPTEFGAKLHLSIDETGFGRIEFLSFDAFNEGPMLIEALNAYRYRKYKGEFIFNRSTGKDPLTKQRNHHQSKPEEEWVIVPNGIPAIISESDFNRVQELLHVRKHVRRPQYIETYLLTGKIFCGVCGHAYQGNRNATHKDRPPYITYRCGNRASRHQTSGCKNKPVNRDAVEAFVLDKLSMNIFNPDIVDVIMDRFKEYANQQNADSQGLIRQYKRSLQSYQRQEENLLQSVTETENAEVRKVLLVQLEKLSEKKAQAQQMLKSITCSNKELPTKAVLKELLQQAKRQFRKGTLQETKKLIDVFVDRVTIGIDEVELKLYLIPPVTNQNIPAKLCQEVITIDRSKLKNIRNKVS